MRLAIILGALALGLATRADAQDRLIAPKPQVTQPAKPASPSGAAGPSKPRTARVPLSQCEEMTKDWVDIRPVRDFPTIGGRTTFDMQQSAISICAEEQGRQPGSARVAFVFARTLEVNGQGPRATELYRQLAAAGYLPAMTQLARAYYIGSGVQQDLVEACSRYMEAARAGDDWALGPAADCASLYAAPPDFRRACQFYRQAKARDALDASARSESEYCP